MRKILALGLMAVVLIAFVSAPAFAQCGGSSTKDIKTTSAIKTTDAKLVSVTNLADCAVKCEEPCKGYTGPCSMVNMSIKGMTCGGCETSIKTALEKVSGVVMVKSISYQDGTAQVCVNPEEAKLESMTKAVSSSGYEVEVIPAVAKTTDKGEVKAATNKAAAGCTLPCPTKSSCCPKGAKTTTAAVKAKDSK